HLDLTHLLIYTGMGLVFSYLYVKTKTIIVPIIVHMGMNTITVLAHLFIDVEELERIQNELGALINLIGGLLIGVCYYVYYVLCIIYRNCCLFGTGIRLEFINNRLCYYCYS